MLLSRVAAPRAFLSWPLQLVMEKLFWKPLPRLSDNLFSTPDMPVSRRRNDADTRDNRGGDVMKNAYHIGIYLPRKMDRYGTRAESERRTRMKIDREIGPKDRELWHPRMGEWINIHIVFSFQFFCVTFMSSIATKLMEFGKISMG